MERWQELSKHVLMKPANVNLPNLFQMDGEMNSMTQFSMTPARQFL